MSKSQGASSRRRTRDRKTRNPNAPSTRNPVEAGFARARRIVMRRLGVL